MTALAGRQRAFRDARQKSNSGLDGLPAITRKRL